MTTDPVPANAVTLCSVAWNKLQALKLDGHFQKTYSSTKQSDLYKECSCFALSNLIAWQAIRRVCLVHPCTSFKLFCQHVFSWHFCTALDIRLVVNGGDAGHAALGCSKVHVTSKGWTFDAQPISLCYSLLLWSHYANCYLSSQFFSCDLGCTQCRALHRKAYRIQISTGTWTKLTRDMTRDRWTRLWHAYGRIRQSSSAFFRGRAGALSRAPAVYRIDLRRTPWVAHLWLQWRCRRCPWDA